MRNKMANKKREKLREKEGEIYKKHRKKSQGALSC